MIGSETTREKDRGQECCRTVVGGVEWSGGDMTVNYKYYALTQSGLTHLVINRKWHQI